MNKHKVYPRTKFDSKALSAASQAFEGLRSEKVRYWNLSVDTGEAVWGYDSQGELLAAADQGWPDLAEGFESDRRYELRILSARFSGNALVDIRAPTREEIESVFAVVDTQAERCRLSEPDQPKKKEIRIFIGHGRDPQWRDLKDHLHEKHGYPVEAYEIGARAGHTIRDILEEMLEESTVAILVMTGEDEAKDGTLHARENVIHEAGLFQGRLGFSRAIILLEEGTEVFSNIQGVDQIRFPKASIRWTFGDVLALLKREFGEAP